MPSRAHLSMWSDRLRSSLWAIPTALIVSAIVLAMGTLALDRRYGADMGASWWVLSAGVEGIRLTLSTIAGSVMTVTGVAFSMTIVVLQLASSQYSPRVIRSFRRDRSIQLVLGIFTGTFVFCLLVLRTIFSSESGPSFTAPISVALAMVLGIVSMLALVGMIHHVAETVRVAAIVRSIALETHDAIERAWPESLGDGTPPETCGARPAPPGAPSAYRAPRDGYVEYIDASTLERVHGASVVRIEVMAGDFVRVGEVLANVWPAGIERSDQAIVDAFALSEERTIQQDVRYGLRLIVDVALRALSPGIQDPRTAVECVDTLGALLCRAARRRMPDPLRRTAHGVVYAPRPGLDELVAVAFHEIIASTNGSVPVLLAIAAALSALREIDPENEPRCGLERARARARHALESASMFPEDREGVQDTLNWRTKS